MKMIALLAAAAAATFAIPASASAAPVSAAGTPMVTHSASVLEVDQRHHNRRASWRRTCTTKWRHHRRVRVCRKVRYWR